MNKNVKNKNTTIVLIFIMFLLFLNCGLSTKQELQQVFKIINEVKEQYCPDARVSLFKVKPFKAGQKLVLKGETISIEAKSRLVSRLKTVTDFQILDSLIVLPDLSKTKDIYGVVKISVAQLRSNPDVDQEIVNQAIMGEEVKVLKKEGFWTYCQLEDKYLGWMMSGSLEIGDNEFIKKYRSSKKFIVIANYGQIWEQPRAGSRSVTDIVRANKLQKKGSTNGWRHVQLADGRSGYVKKQLVMAEEKFKNRPYPKADLLVNLAYQFIGIPYLWGGRSTKALDCSGFTQTVYNFYGIDLPRDANMQVKAGEPVDIETSLETLQTGDLLFFGRKKGRITHVGMYINDGKFIHSDGYVHINSFNPEDEDFSEYRLNHLQEARRILKNN